MHTNLDILFYNLPYVFFNRSFVSMDKSNFFKIGLKKGLKEIHI